MWKHEYGENDTSVGNAIGVRQQTARALRLGERNAGYLTACAIAEHDRVPVDLLLLGIPAELYRAISKNPRRWGEAAVAMGGRLHLRLPGARKYDFDEWCKVLDRCDEVVRTLVSDLHRKP